MNRLFELVIYALLAAYFVVPLWVLGTIGYRYGYKQSFARYGLVWRALVWPCLLSWSLVTAPFVALPLPSAFVLFRWRGGISDTSVLPRLWVAPLFQILLYLAAVAYGYAKRERTYTPFPKQP